VIADDQTFRIGQMHADLIAPSARDFPEDDAGPSFLTVRFWPGQIIAGRWGFAVRVEFGWTP
jgi:hypothetical protein